MRPIVSNSSAVTSHHNGVQRIAGKNGRPRTLADLRPCLAQVVELGRRQIGVAVAQIFDCHAVVRGRGFHRSIEIGEIVDPRCTGDHKGKDQTTQRCPPHTSLRLDCTV